MFFPRDSAGFSVNCEAVWWSDEIILPAGKTAILGVTGVLSFIIAGAVFCKEAGRVCCSAVLLCPVKATLPEGNTGILCSVEVVVGGEVVAPGKVLVFCTTAVVS